MKMFVRRELFIEKGVLGFYATGQGPNDIKGNFGILDQRLAIAWTKANIDVFGGDPNQVSNDASLPLFI